MKLIPHYTMGEIKGYFVEIDPTGSIGAVLQILGGKEQQFTFGEEPVFRRQPIVQPRKH